VPRAWRAVYTPEKTKVSRPRTARAARKTSGPRPCASAGSEGKWAARTRTRSGCYECGAAEPGSAAEGRRPHTPATGILDAATRGRRRRRFDAAAVAAAAVAAAAAEGRGPREEAGDGPAGLLRACLRAPEGAAGRAPSCWGRAHCVVGLCQSPAPGARGSRRPAPGGARAPSSASDSTRSSTKPIARPCVPRRRRREGRGGRA
jgi:hypothetical protein